jgi:hypothetical protein
VGHIICAYRYLLAVRDPGEGGDAAVYDLGELGTIEKLEWQPPRGDRPSLQLTALNFPAHVFEYWPGLDRERGTFVLSIGADSLTIRRTPPARP